MNGKETLTLLLSISRQQSCEPNCLFSWRAARELVKNNLPASTSFPAEVRKRIASQTDVQTVMMRLACVPENIVKKRYSQVKFNQMHSCDHGYSKTHTYPTNPCSNQNTTLPQQIREMKMICFILKI